MTDRFEGLVDHLLNGGISLAEATQILERSMISGALNRNANNQCAAARSLKVHRNTLQRKMVEYGLGRRKPVGRVVGARKKKSRIA